jgi:hypothetical protein
MHDDISSGALWTMLYGSGTLTGLGFLGLIVIAIVLTAQLEAAFSACRTLLAHRRQLVLAQQRLEKDVSQTLQTAAMIDQSLPELRETIDALVREYERLDIQATAARTLSIREIVVSDIFVPAGDRPFLAMIYRPQAAPDEPFAAQWRAGREHIVYGNEKKAAAARFAQRYPKDHGFVIGPVSVFDIPRNPPEELPTLDQA